MLFATNLKSIRLEQKMEFSAQRHGSVD